MGLKIPADNAMPDDALTQSKQIAYSNNSP